MNVSDSVDMNDDQWRELCARYRKRSFRRAWWARCDAYAMMLWSLRHGRDDSFQRISADLNGGLCDPYAIRAGIRDAKRDYAEFATPALGGAL